MKELNKKEAVGDLLDAFKEVSVLEVSGDHAVSISSYDELCFVPSCLGH